MSSAEDLGPGRRKMPLSPSMPDLVTKQPTALWTAGEHYILALVEDLPPASARILGGPAGETLRYDATIAVLDRRLNAPRMLVTLERSAAGTFFCCFNQLGNHENLGPSPGMTMKAFCTKALALFCKRFGFTGDIERRK